MRSQKSYLDAAHNSIVKVFASRIFFYATAVLAAMQGLWYAFTIKDGMYDEGTHLGFISLYTHHLGPFIYHQSSQWDFLGEVTRNGSYLFYYLMSFPARFVDLFTDSRTALVIALRVLMIITFIIGLFIYRRVLLAAGISKSIVHVGLLVLLLIPMIAPELGVVNYDNAVFLLTAVLLLLAVRLVKSDKLDITRLVLLSIVGLVGSEIKFEFVAIFVPVFAFVVYDLARKHGRELGREIVTKIRSLPRKFSFLLVAGLVVSLSLFIERPVYNFVVYQNLNGANCTQVISRDRCFKNPIVKRNTLARENKPTSFRPLNPITYTSAKWAPTMIGTLIIVLAGVPILLVPAIFYYTFFYGGVAVILLYLRSFLRRRLSQLLLFSMFAYVILLLLFNYSGYATSGSAFAMNGRYLLPVLPIFIVYVLASLKNIFAVRYPKVAVASLCIGLLLLASQGGGIGTAVLTIPDTFYWKNSTTENFNQRFKNVLHRVVFERNPFSNPFQ